MRRLEDFLGLRVVTYAVMSNHVAILIEGDAKALMTKAAYIDLNAYRAVTVDRVEEYRGCGYASAAAGNRWARMGVGRILWHSVPVNRCELM